MWPEQTQIDLLLEEARRGEAQAIERLLTVHREPLPRLLYVGIALLLRNVWVWLHWQVLAHRRRGGRRIDLGRLSFRKMLVWLQHWIEARLGVRDEIPTEHRMYE